MPVEKWKYKEGVSDEGHHIVQYAEDFKEQTGLGDGKSINLIDGLGLTMKAVQELSSKVDKIAETGVGLPKMKKQQESRYA